MPPSETSWQAVIAPPSIAARTKSPAACSAMQVDGRRRAGLAPLAAVQLAQPERLAEMAAAVADRDDHVADAP